MRHVRNMHALLRHAQLAKAFEQWLREEGECLLEAADLLGGPEWTARAATTVEAIADGQDPAGRLQDLRALRRLLTLELVEDFGSAEAGFFAAIHPDDRRAESIRTTGEPMTRASAPTRSSRASRLSRSLWRLVFTTSTR